MSKLYFVTHPQVVIDPKVPVPNWHLSHQGIEAARNFAAGNVLQGLGEVWASTETKAIETAGILAAQLGLGVKVDANLGENDRSATGYLPKPEFEATANAFFASPEFSVRGWERAIDAQTPRGRCIQPYHQQVSLPMTSRSPLMVALEHSYFVIFWMCPSIAHMINQAKVTIGLMIWPAVRSCIAGSDYSTKSLGNYALGRNSVCLLTGSFSKKPECLYNFPAVKRDISRHSIAFEHGAAVCPGRLQRSCRQLPYCSVDT